MFFVTYAIQRFHNSPIIFGKAVYDDENEMYADLEVQGITEDNPDVLNLQFFELITENGKVYAVNSWM